MFPALALNPQSLPEDQKLRLLVSKIADTDTTLSSGCPSAEQPLLLPPEETGKCSDALS